jgi:assimilatory nitrate reductase catalytic subunit
MAYTELSIKQTINFMLAPKKLTQSTCPYCGVGCGVVIESSGDQITGVRGDTDHPANHGRLCTKGSTLHMTAQPMQLQLRLLHPQIRHARPGKPARASWDDTFALMVDRFEHAIREHGPDSVAFYISGQLLTEDYYVFNKLAKGLIGTNNIDTNSRLCMSSAVAGYKQTLGADAPPPCYDDITLAQCLFIAGSNMAVAHPVLFRSVEEAKRANPQLRIIVADPRRTDTASVADLHLAIQPGTDVALFNGMLHIMLWEGWTDRNFIEQHTQGFDALRTLVRNYTSEHVSRLCGISPQALADAARSFAQSAATLSLYCQGLNQSTSGTAKNAALINLHLATGQIGKPGAGPFSLTGQPNAMGGREVGGMANLLSAHRDLSNSEHRDEVARLWGVPSVPAAPGKTAIEMFEAAANGDIKALWIACTNPAQSLPDQRLVRAALERCDFVVLQDCYRHTATARYADVLLPASTWGEKDGTVTNSERRISRVRPAVTAPGEAQHDWQIAVNFAQQLERRLRNRDAPSLFDYASAEQVWNEHRESTRGRDLDITGLSYALLDQAPQQWPMPQGATQGRARLYEDRRFATADGKARFVAVEYAPPAEVIDARFPFALNTGRLRDQWHGASRTGTVPALFGSAPQPVVEMNRADMTRRGLKDGDLVHVTSRRGSQILPVQASAQLAPSQAFIAMHWGEEFLSGSALSGLPTLGVNALSQPAVCPSSKQPELKHSAVKILKAELPWRLSAFAWLDASIALTQQRAMRELMPQFSYASCVLVGAHASAESASRVGVWLRAAAYAPADAALVASIERLLQIEGAQLMRYEDRRRHLRRVLKVHDGALHGAMLAGDASAEGWLLELLRSESPVAPLGRALMMPGADAPRGLVSKGKQVCNCLGVWERDIDTLLATLAGSSEEQLAQLQQRLGCGTQCGSCVPEIKARLGLQLQTA